MSDEDKERFEQVLRNSNKVAIRLRELIRERKASLEKFELSDDLYDLPSPEIKIAFINGRRRELRDLESLFDFLPQP